jgi:hypothetical protein
VPRAHRLHPSAGLLLERLPPPDRDTLQPGVDLMGAMAEAESGPHDTPGIRGYMPGDPHEILRADGVADDQLGAQASDLLSHGALNSRGEIVAAEPGYGPAVPPEQCSESWRTRESSIWRQASGATAEWLSLELRHQLTFSCQPMGWLAIGAPPRRTERTSGSSDEHRSERGDGATNHDRAWASVPGGSRK